MPKIERDVSDIKVLLSLLLNERGRTLSTAERFVFDATCKRLGLVIHRREGPPMFENSAPIRKRK